MALKHKPKIVHKSRTILNAGKICCQSLAESKECLPHPSDNAKTSSKSFLFIMIIYESLTDRNDFKSMLACNYQREGRHSMDAAYQYENKITPDI